MYCCVLEGLGLKCEILLLLKTKEILCLWNPNFEPLVMEP